VQARGTASGGPTETANGTFVRRFDPDAARWVLSRPPLEPADCAIDPNKGFVSMAIRPGASATERPSAALHRAVGLLRTAQLADAYEDAWTSWDSSDDSEAWDAALADGLDS
jgi:hypothetical protein